MRARLSQSSPPGSVHSTCSACTWREKVTWFAARSTRAVFPISLSAAPAPSPQILTTRPLAGGGRKPVSSASRLVTSESSETACVLTRPVWGEVTKIQSPFRKLWRSGSWPAMGRRVSSEQPPLPLEAMSCCMQAPFRSRVCDIVVAAISAQFTPSARNSLTAQRPKRQKYEEAAGLGKETSPREPRLSKKASVSPASDRTPTWSMRDPSCFAETRPVLPASFSCTTSRALSAAPRRRHWVILFISAWMLRGAGSCGPCVFCFFASGTPSAGAPPGIAQEGMLPKPPWAVPFGAASFTPLICSFARSASAAAHCASLLLLPVPSPSPPSGPGTCTAQCHPGPPKALYCLIGR
mmetsp:Transcript_35555/g.99911  ORF Transcript_35555/g.99911 Transcript_35555/m.99911 type:complete len:352 (+) Transcript_35555:837-1892(+)